eukprot:6193453-Pleurochrysis_carterae.AAC.3
MRGVQTYSTHAQTAYKPRSACFEKRMRGYVHAVTACYLIKPQEWRAAVGLLKLCRPRAELLPLERSVIAP